MGAQHDFAFVFPTSALKCSIEDLGVLMEEDDVLKDDLGYEINEVGETVEISFSFYSSYAHLNEVEARMKELFKKILTPGTTVINNYEVVSTESETFVV